jgi:hypothetical protein
MDGDLILLVYVSSATRLYSRDELMEILRKGRANNMRAGITGMLLYHDGSFMQAIEGPTAAVEALEARIARDPHHHGMIGICRRPITERAFSDWSMGFAYLDRELDEEDGIHNLRAESFLAEDFTTSPSTALKLLRHFARQADAGARLVT